MTISFQCPKCRKPINAPDHYAGRQSKCPGCSVKVTVPSKPADDEPFGFTSSGGVVSSVAGRAVSSAGEEDDAESPAMLKLRQAGGWQSVAGGLNNIWMGTGLVVLGFITVNLVVGILQGTGQNVMAAIGKDTATPMAPGFRALAIAGNSCVGIFLVGGTIFRLIGFFRCLAAPAGRFFAVLMLGSELASLGGFLGIVLGLFLHPVVVGLGSLANILGGLFGVVFLLLFLSGIGTGIGSKPLRARVRHFLIWLLGGIGGIIVIVGIAILLIAIATAGTDSGPPSAVQGIIGLAGFCSLGLASIVIPLIIFIKYLRTLAIGSDELKKRTGRYWI